MNMEMNGDFRGCWRRILRHDDATSASELNLVDNFLFAVSFLAAAAAAVFMERGEEEVAARSRSSCLLNEQL
jgi:hypothetical protein